MSSFLPKYFPSGNETIIPPWQETESDVPSKILFIPSDFNVKEIFCTQTGVIVAILATSSLMQNFVIWMDALVYLPDNTEGTLVDEILFRSELPDTPCTVFDGNMMAIITLRRKPSVYRKLSTFGLNGVSYPTIPYTRAITCYLDIPRFVNERYGRGVPSVEDIYNSQKTIIAKGEELIARRKALDLKAVVAYKAFDNQTEGYRKLLEEIALERDEIVAEYSRFNR